MATVEGNVGDYNRYQGGTAVEFGYDVVVLLDGGNPRQSPFHKKPVQRAIYKNRSSVPAGEGWDDICFNSNDLVVPRMTDHPSPFSIYLWGQGRVRNRDGV